MWQLTGRMDCSPVVLGRETEVHGAVTQRIAGVSMHSKEYAAFSNALLFVEAIVSNENSPCTPADCRKAGQLFEAVLNVSQCHMCSSAHISGVLLNAKLDENVMLTL